MNVKIAAENLKLLVEREYGDGGLAAPEQHPDGTGTPHAIWMLNRIIDGEVEGEKAHRWLGDAAGMLRQIGVVTLDGCKYANLFS